MSPWVATGREALDGSAPGWGKGQYELSQIKMLGLTAVHALNEERQARGCWSDAMAINVGGQIQRSFHR